MITLRVLILFLLSPIMFLGGLYAILLFGFMLGKEFTLDALKEVFPL